VRPNKASSTAILTTYVALFRGINVGTAKRVAMADLRALFESLGYKNVRTLLNSGNVVLDVPGASKSSPAARIEKAFSAKIGFSSRITLLTATELATVVGENPLLEHMTNPSLLQVAVVTDPADVRKLKPLVKEDWGAEAIALGPRVAYVWSPAGTLESKVLAALGKTLRDGVTVRNWATMLKLGAIVSASS
jgi:uncharacterized protein (DUF1697 family)